MNEEKIIPWIDRSKATTICFGAKEEYLSLPIVNLPPDTIKVRRKIRERGAAVAFVKTKTELQKWILCPEGNALRLGVFQGANRKWK